VRTSLCVVQALAVIDADRETLPQRVPVAVIDALDEKLASLERDPLTDVDVDKEAVVHAEVVPETDCEIDGEPETVSAELTDTEFVAYDAVS
jgi:hypothetical protein